MVVLVGDRVNLLRNVVKIGGYRQRLYLGGTHARCSRMPCCSFNSIGVFRLFYRKKVYLTWRGALLALRSDFLPENVANCVASCIVHFNPVLVRSQPIGHFLQAKISCTTFDTGTTSSLACCGLGPGGHIMITHRMRRRNQRSYRPSNGLLAILLAHILIHFYLAVHFCPFGKEAYFSAFQVLLLVYLGVFRDLHLVFVLLHLCELLLEAHRLEEAWI